MKYLNDLILSFMTDHIAKIMGIVIAIVVVLTGLNFIPKVDKPKQAKEYAKTSVIITDANGNSGGSGVILRSNAVSSEILTNKHVCALAVNGGRVIKDDHIYLVDAIKKYPYHDLCLVRVQSGLKVNTKVSLLPPASFSDAFISGHPNLLPHVLTTGNFSGYQIINLITGLKKCDENTPAAYAMYCAFFGGIPIIESFQSQLVTGTILPGSSGSGVFNEYGEISGLVFAGQGQGLGYAFIVPHEYVVDFLEIEELIPYIKVNQLDRSKLIYDIFNMESVCKPESKHYNTFKSMCSKIAKYGIWRKK